jgi:hypothetical protein
MDGKLGFFKEFFGDNFLGTEGKNIFKRYFLKSLHNGPFVGF